MYNRYIASEAVQNAVISKYSDDMNISYIEWQEQIKESDIRCQWDPERDQDVQPLGYCSIQLGLRGEAVRKYINEWIVSFTDITDYVRDLKEQRSRGIGISLLLPKEEVYTARV